MVRYLLAILGGCLVASPALAQMSEMSSLLIPSVTVSGKGELRAAPNEAEITVGVVTQDTSAAQAMEKNNNAVQQLLVALEEMGIARRDIRTTSFNVSPQYNYDREGRLPPEIIGYQASNQVQVKVRELEQLGTLLDQLIQQGANQVHGVQLSVRDEQQRLDEVRQQALNDARRKAELYARAAGARLGRVLLVEETPQGFSGPMPRQHFATEARAAAVPIAPGEQTLEVDVQVTFALTYAGAGGRRDSDRGDTQRRDTDRRERGRRDTDRGNRTESSFQEEQDI